MKLKTIISTTILSLAITSQAMAYNANSVEECAKISSLAERIVQMRYDGVSMADMMRAVGHSDLGRPLVRAAYALPDYHSHEYQQRAKRSLSNKVMQTCMDTLD